MSKDLIDEYQDLKQRVESAQQQADQAQGRLDQLMDNLKKDFGCTSLKKAKIKLAGMQKKTDASKIDFRTAKKEFEENWEEQLEDDDE